MIVRILGSAAGGGVPQWNCNCTNCRAARAGTQPRRTQSCAAASTDGERWLLLNCSPDIGMQIESFEPLLPRGIRGTPIAGMLFTDANVDHMGGLATLRQAGSHRFIVRSSPVIRAIAQTQPAFEPFTRTPHAWVDAAFDANCSAVDDDDIVGNELLVRAMPVPGTTPGYDGRRTQPGAVVAYELQERNGLQRVLFAPVFAALDDALLAAIARADIAILDGSFYSDDELSSGGMMDKSARSLGHLPVGSPGGTLERLAGIGTRVVFTHLNNTNPMLDPDTPQSAIVRDAGAAIAYDGLEIRL